MKRFLIIALLILPFSFASADAAWYDANWIHRKKITITGNASAGANYPVELLIGETSGATGEQFDLGGNSAIFPPSNDNGGDLRFTDNDGTTLLSFYVASSTGVTPNRMARVWVEVADSLASNQDIYVYYDNASATNGSNGTTTFTLFDDFNSGATIDSSKWTVSGATQGGGLLKVGELSNGQRYASSTYSYPTGYSMMFFGRMGSESYTTTRSGLVNYVAETGAGLRLIFSDTHIYNFIGDSANYSDSGYTFTTAATSTYEIQRTSTSSARFFMNYVRTPNPAGTFTLEAGPVFHAGNSVHHIDWMAIRTFVDTEPVFSAIGAEEPTVTPTASNPLLLISDF